MKKFKGMSPATVKRLKRLIEEPEVTWGKTDYNETGSCGDRWGKLWFSLDLDDWGIGWVFVEGITHKVVTKKFKTKAAAKKAAEKWLRGKA